MVKLVSYNQRGFKEIICAFLVDFVCVQIFKIVSCDIQITNFYNLILFLTFMLKTMKKQQNSQKVHTVIADFFKYFFTFGTYSSDLH